MCECYKIGGPWVAEDPDCPIHGRGGVWEAEKETREREQTLENRIEDLE